ncbi:sulfite exporter TauE/SafE family protein [Saccharobesus litoralis]|uniref:Sulfite exporter TauE/SafE family protein n=1 Tax=Saccharobesus litoralis TaxID=2172099 RepID=A0A2S0VSY9_9ALTE|nr:sulfite exporter TauE/SafE family protein [Saccharobesus litoralis]AWB67331.1 sulfite exporter TauE/SafE family protein [Saccharobesus litoralis]
MLTELISAFTIGFLASSHCLAMCGGISAAIGHDKNCVAIAAYHLGRITTYTLIGALVGLASQTLLSEIKPALIVVKVLAGSLIILMGLYVARLSLLINYFEKLFTPLWQLIQPHAAKTLKQKSISQRFVAGALWGWLPCGLVYSTVAWAMSSTSLYQGALIMLCFGIGTLPSMLTTSFMSQQVVQLLKHNQVKLVAGLSLCAYGIYTIFVGVLQL